ncbi:MAG TPA: tandem-95 repeat protein, partial [Gammaproteobacteria bacterium]|nr:tandem-95 repeat protein [Gammaproteobacteria bacterium]
MAIKHGKQGNDTIVGTAQHDKLFGQHGDDILWGAGGDDDLDGGHGFDIARYSGSFFDYRITADKHGDYTVADLRAGRPDGVDSLRKVEALQFSDRIIYIDGRNNAPVTVNDSASGSEDIAVRIAASTLLANDRDFDGDALALVSVGGATHGSVSLANGIVTFTPAASYNGAAAFNYTVRDARGAQSTGTVNLSIQAVNDAPVNTVPGAKSVDEDTTLTIGGISVSDVDAATVRVTLSAAHGALSLSRTSGLTFTSGDGVSDATMTFSGTQANVNAALGNLSYRPTANYNGADAIRLTTTDLGGTGTGGALSDTDTINVTVRPVNDAPVAATDARSVNEDTRLTAASVLANDSDVDGNTLTARLVSGPAHGSLTLNADGTFVYTPVANFNGADSFTYRAFDGTTTSNPATVSIAVKSVNDAPTFFGSHGRVIVDFGQGQETGRAIAIQPNGKIVIAGEAAGGMGGARFNTDGSADSTFDGDGQTLVAFPLFDGVPFGMALQANGRIAIAGYGSNSNEIDFALARLNANGSLDATFDGDGRVMTGFTPGSVDIAHAVAVQADGKLVAAGGSSFYDFSVVRYNANGSLDTTFSGDGRAITALSADPDYANAVAVQSNGKIVAAGFRNNGAQDDFALVRYNADGSLDTTFDGDGIVITDFSGGNDVITGIAVQSDGRILVSGYSESTPGQTVFAAACYNANGTLDTAFDGDGKLTTGFDGLNSAANAVALQANGKFVLAGAAASNIAIARYNADGSLDTSFDGDGRVISDAGSVANAVALQADGGIVIGGALHAQMVVARFNANGSLDTTFGRGNTLDASPTFIEDQAPVVLDSDVLVFDAELAAQGHYAGARVTLVRHGGANAEDVYSNAGTLGLLAQGSALVYDGVNVGTVTTNSGGTLVLAFNSGATQDRVNGVLQAIAYSNSSDTPPASVQIDWSFSDGNTGAQGAGGALSATGSTTVAILSSLDRPIAANDSYATDEGVPLLGSSVLANDHDPDGDTLTAVLASGPSHGSLVLNDDGTFTY